MFTRILALTACVALSARPILAETEITDKTSSSITDVLDSLTGYTTASAAIKANSEWVNNDSKSLILASDDAISKAQTNKVLASGNAGIFYYKSPIDYGDTSNAYQVLYDSDTEDAIIFDNWSTEDNDVSMLHVRTSTSEGVISAAYQCSDGYLFINPNPIEPSVKPSISLTYQPDSSKYLSLFDKIGATDGLNSLTDTTIFSVIDSVYNDNESYFNSLSNYELAYYLASFICNSAFFSTGFPSTCNPILSGADLITVNTGTSAGITTTDGSATFNVTDTPCASGVIYSLNDVIKISSFPNATVTIGSWTYGKSSSSSSSTSTATGTGKKNSGSSHIVVPVAVPILLSVFVATFVAFVF